MRLFYVQFLVNKVCNQDCYYCDIEKKGYEGEWELDIDYLKWMVRVLAEETSNLMVELSGGEPGLCNNLESAINFLRNQPNVVKIQLMSNGLVRWRFPHLVNEVHSYNEHLIKEINGTTQELFYPMDHVNTAGLKHPNAKSVVVLTPKTTKSLLDHFSYFKDIGMFEDNFWYKVFVPRTINTTHFDEMTELLTKLGQQDRANFSDDVVAQAMCSKRPQFPVIDLESGRIIHCAFHDFVGNVSKLALEHNLRALVNKSLWIEEPTPRYCKDCYLFCRDKKLLMSSQKANRIL